MADFGVNDADAAAINAALGITPSAEPAAPVAEAPTEVANPPVEVAAETSAPAPTATATTTVETAAPVAAAPTPTDDIPQDKLQALLQAKKRIEAPATKAAQEAALIAAQAAKVQGEFEATKQELETMKGYLQLFKKDPVKFAKEVAKIEDPKEIDRLSRDLYMYSLGDKAPQAYAEIQRRRENETEVEMLRRKLSEIENKIETRDTERSARENLNAYVAESKATIATTTPKDAPWVARAFKSNPETATQELVNLATYVYQQTGETMKPADLIPILEGEMVKRFGKYDFGEAKPTTPTLNNALSTPSKRTPAPPDEDKEASLSRIIAGIEAGEHLRE